MGEGITEHRRKSFLGCILSKCKFPRWASDGLKEQPGGSMAITGMSSGETGEAGEEVKGQWVSTGRPFEAQHGPWLFCLVR